MFLSPLSREEILFLHNEARVSLPDLVADVMRRKVSRRAQRQKDLSLKDLEEIERRAGGAYRELKEAHHFEYVIPNYDGEDSDNWEAFYTETPASRRTRFVRLLPPRPVDHGTVASVGVLAVQVREREAK